jgi:purine nucleoside phosphorylase
MFSPNNVQLASTFATSRKYHILKNRKIKMEQVNIGIIGGSGLYQMPELKNVREIEVDTPFGKTVGRVYRRRIGKRVKVAFLPRHGRGIN